MHFAIILYKLKQFDYYIHFLWYPEYLLKLMETFDHLNLDYSEYNKNSIQ